MTRDPLALAMFAAWVNVPADKTPLEYRQHTCEATMAAWQRVGQAAVAFMDQALAARVAELEADRKALLEETGSMQTKAAIAVDATRDAQAREAKLREALVMAKQHMIVNDLSLPNVFAVIDAALLAEAQGLIYAARQERDAAEDQEKELAEELRTVRRNLAELEADMAVLTANKDAAHHLRRENLARAEAAEAREAKLREALRNIDALDPEGMANGCSPDAIKGLVSRMGEIARAALQETKP